MKRSLSDERVREILAAHAGMTDMGDTTDGSVSDKEVVLLAKEVLESRKGSGRRRIRRAVRP